MVMYLKMGPARHTMPAACCLKALDLSHTARSAAQYHDCDDGDGDGDHNDSSSDDDGYDNAGDDAFG